MKSERRHELQTNTLSIELIRLADFLKKHVNQIAWGALIAAVVLLAITFWYRKHSSTVAERSAAFDQAVNATLNQDLHSLLEGAPAGGDEQVAKLKELAGQTSDKRIAALSASALGDHYFTRALNPVDRAEATPEADKWYQKVLNEFAQEPLAVAKARFGLAKLAEMDRNFAKAKAYYEQVATTPAVAGEPVAAFAQQALANLPGLEGVVKMATTMPAPAETLTPAPASTPASKPAEATSKPAETAITPSVQSPKPAKAATQAGK